MHHMMHPYLRSGSFASLSGQGVHFALQASEAFFDGVAVLEGGRVVEAGRPGDLMQRAGSALAGLARAAGKRGKGAVA
jgi:hypothetical protein